MKRAVLYARVSTDDRVKTGGENLRAQIELCHNYAEEKGYVVVAELSENDRGASGASFDLPELSKALQMARQGDFDVFIVRELDRLSRDLAKQLIVEQELAQSGVTIEYVLYDFPDTPEGRLNKNLRAMLAEYEREKIRQRMSRGRRRKVQNGEVMTHGRTPLGYREAIVNKAKTLVIDEEEGDIVKLIFKLYVEGEGTRGPLSIQAIRDHLDALGIPTYTNRRKSHTFRNGRLPKTTQWEKGTISQILSNETYIGHWRYAKSANDADTLPSVSVTPIIDMATWDKAQRRKQQNKDNAKRNQRYSYLMGKLLYCKECGYKITSYCCVGRKKQLTFYYRCGAHAHKVVCPLTTRSFRAELVDAIAWQQIREWLTDSERLKQSLEEYQERQKELTLPQRERLSAVNNLIQDNNDQLERLLDLYLSGEFPKEALTERKVRLETTLKGLRDEQTRLQVIIAEQEFSEERISSIVSFAEAIREELDQAETDFDVKRRIIEGLNVSGELTIENEERVLYLHCVLGSTCLPIASTSP